MLSRVGLAACAGGIRYLLPVAFFLLLAAGPVPLKLSGILIDHAVSASVLLTLIYLQLKQRSIHAFGLIAIIASLFAAMAPSVAFSSNPEYSMQRYTISIAYGLAFCFFISVASRLNAVAMRWAALAAFFLIALTIVYLFNFSAFRDYYGQLGFRLSLDYGDFESTRFAEDTTVDVNITAFGLVLTFLCAAPLFVFSRKRRITGTIAFLLLIYALLVLGSRTGLISFALSMAVYSAYAVRHGGRYVLGNALGAFAIVALGMAAMLSMMPDQIDRVLSRFEDIVYEESKPTGRLDLISTALDCYTGEILPLVFGCGYAVYNPHNELLAHFFNSGILSGILYIFILIAVCRKARASAYRLFGTAVVVDMVMLPLIFALLVYGHTKTFWAAMAIAWLGSVHDPRVHANLLPSAAHPD